MNLSCIVGFVICSTGTMSTAMMMILLLLIHMKGIPLDMIQTEAILQLAPHLLQKPLIAQQFTFASIRLLFRTVPALAELTDKATIPSYYCEKQGDKTLFTPTVPQTESLKLLFAFG